MLNVGSLLDRRYTRTICRAMVSMQQLHWGKCSTSICSKIASKLLNLTTLYLSLMMKQFQGETMLRCAVTKLAPLVLKEGAAATLVVSRHAPAARFVSLRYFATEKSAPAPKSADSEVVSIPGMEGVGVGMQNSKYYTTKTGEVKLKPWEEEGVVLAEVVDSLEWTLSSPPPVHQFEEPPIIVEIDETGWVGEPIYDETGTEYHWVDPNHDNTGDFMLRAQTVDLSKV